MKTTRIPPLSAAVSSRYKRVALVGTTALLTTLMLASCGSSSGGDIATAQVKTTTVGPIAGFGSVIINGVRYDDSSASVTTDNGASLSRSELRLGMMVELSGSSSSTTNTGSANTITVVSEIKGVVESVSGDSIMVNGFVITLTPTTVFDDLITPRVGDFVEIYGVFAATDNSVIATRIERKSPSDFKFRGTVSNWDATNAQFQLGSQLLNYSGTTLPTGFDNGVAVRAYASAAPNNGAWPVSGVRLVTRSRGDNGERAEITGTIDSLIGTSDFSMNGLTVNAANARFDDGNATDLAIGRWVEVKGTFADGQLIATRVEFEDGDRSSSSDRSDSFEITGRISNYTDLAEFSVRNTRIDASQSPIFERGTAANLGNGVCVEIKGNPISGPSGTVVLASEIKFDNDCS